MSASPLRAPALVLGLAAAILLLATAGGVATPLWIDPGDSSIQTDLAVLDSHGLIDGPLLTWPVSWAWLETVLRDAGKTTDLPPHVAAAMRRLRTRAHAHANVSYELRLSTTNAPRVVRSFSRPVRDHLDTQASVEYRRGRWFARGTIGYEAGDLDDLKPDGSYLAVAVGNWIVSAGYSEAWWGGGLGNSLVLSNNARSFPRVGLMRSRPARPHRGWLRWLGRWRVDVHVGVLDDDRVVSSPLFVGMRWTSRLFHRFDFGLTRTFMIAGSGRPSGFDTWMDALFPFGNAENVLTPDNPSNQLAGFDGRYAFRLGSSDVALFGQYYGEDEIDLWLRTVFGLGGVSVTRPLGSSGALWQISGEYSDTAADAFEDRPTVFNAVYDHRIYENGYRYRGRSIGHSLDGDGRLVSFTLGVVEAGGRGYTIGYHYARLNRDGRCQRLQDGTCTHSVSASAEDMNILALGARLPGVWGSLDVEARLEDDRANTPGSTPSRAAFRFDWRRRF